MPVANFSRKSAFTLPELLISISILATVAVIVSGSLIQSFRSNKKSNIEARIYSDAAFIIKKIANEVQKNVIDYDEYYNEYVLVPGIPGNNQNPTAYYGQNFGRYYSSFFHPGDDEILGFDCNHARNGGMPYAATDDDLPAPTRSDRRNTEDCVPLRKTLDRQTGSNPYMGKSNEETTGDEENAFCATPRITPNQALANVGLCVQIGGANAVAVSKLFLITPDATQKTILARERIGGANPNPKYALSILRMKGEDASGDTVIDSFSCAHDFECVTSDCEAATLPRNDAIELNPPALNDDICDTRANGFTKDFVPISPLTVSVSSINFVITPLEDPNYAFAENDQSLLAQVTINLTVEANKEELGAGVDFAPVTFSTTVYANRLEKIPAPLLVR